MSVNFECPICMDDIMMSVNCVTTECGHCFHSSCLMRNIAHNGFGCPYCRTVLAEKPPSDEDDDDWEEEEDEVYNNNVLRGFRLFFHNVYGLEQEEEDIIDENDENEEVEEEIVPIVKPSPILIANKLIEKGVTMEQLVKILLLNDHEEYTENEDEFNQVDNEIFGKIRIIISNYHPSQEPVLLPVIEAQNPIQEIDNTAQPKSNNNVTIRRRPIIL